MTSEQRFKLQPQPGETCPLIDHGQSLVQKLLDNSTGNRTDNLDEDELRELVHDIERTIDWYAPDVDAQFEKVRDHVVKIREWGEQWKCFVKDLHDEIEPLRELDEQLTTWKGITLFVYEKAILRIRATFEKTQREQFTLHTQINIV